MGLFYIARRRQIISPTSVFLTIFLNQCPCLRIYEIRWNTTLILAARATPDANLVRLLIESGANVNAKNGDHETALMYAASKGQVEVVELLIKNGADVNATNANGQTAMVMAAAKAHTAVVRMLKDTGAR